MALTECSEVTASDRLSNSYTGSEFKFNNRLEKGTEISDRPVYQT